MRVLTMPVLFTLLTLAVQAEEITVSMSVEASEDSLKSQITSFMMRELRSLRDIRIMADKTKADYNIEIVAITDHNAGSQKVIGHVISALLTAPARPYIFLRPLGYSTSDVRKIIGVLTENSYVVNLGHKVFSFGPNDIKWACEKYVAETDAETFELYRAASREQSPK